MKDFAKKRVALLLADCYLPGSLPVSTLTGGSERLSVSMFQDSERFEVWSDKSANPDNILIKKQEYGSCPGCHDTSQKFNTMSCGCICGSFIPHAVSSRSTKVYPNSNPENHRFRKPAADPYRAASLRSTMPAAEPNCAASMLLKMPAAAVAEPITE